MTKEEIKEILEKHMKWLNRIPGGEQAVLKNVDLRNVDLSSANLSYANLSDANLGGAVLSNTDLSNTDLSNANLSNTDLSNAHLWNANLQYANLWNANLWNADLRGANLSNANLRYADLRGANLSVANLQYANLWNADLWNVNLKRADLRGAQGIPFIGLACPDTGSFIGWKKIEEYIIKLEIPADAKRSSATTSKCRCEFAKVLEIQNLNGTEADIEEIININYEPHITYKVGEMVYPNKFDDCRWNECSNGIHFFINRQEAVEY